MDNISIIFLSFLIYSIIGWITETIYVSIKQKKLSNRGFLIGPCCPVYGVSAMTMLFTLSKYKNDIVVTGFISELEKECFYRNASCLVFPSLYEGFGFPILEAMSVGLSVVTSNVSSMPEIGKDSAFYVEKLDLHNKEIIAKVINDALNISDDKRAELKRKMNMIVQSHSRRESAESIYQLLLRKGN